MTDVTELAQSLKAAATNVKETAHIARYLKATIARQTFKELMTPDNILALVDALEKAQKRISRLESRSVKLPKAMSIEGGAYCSANAHYDSDGDYYDRTDVEEMLSAAGIKVEAE